MESDSSIEQLLAKKARNNRHDELGDSSPSSSDCSLLTNGGLTGYAAYRNMGSSIFNLMNAVIGAGIISLGYAASVLGTINFMVVLSLVVAMSAFTMLLVCDLSKSAGCYQDLAAEKGIAGEIEICRRGEPCNHRRMYSYEKIAELLFSGKIKLLINLVILFYLANALTAYFIILKV
jgi:hypothetical protein